jgi:hypothetical protein
MTLSEDHFREIVTLTAQALAALDGVLSADDLVEPSGKYFPDEFALDGPAVAKLVNRMRAYTPLSADLPLAVGFTEPDGQASGGGCGTSACSTPGEAHVARGGFAETDDGYGVIVDVRDVPEAPLLTASIARSLGGIVLREAEVETHARALGLASELCASAMGLGLIIAMGACVYKKGCGGMKMHRGTEATVEEATTALALYCRTRGVPPSRARAHLEVTQREAFDDALRLVDSNVHITRELRDNPELLADGAFTVHPAKGLLGRLFAKKEARTPEIAPSRSAKPVKKTARSPQEEARLLEARRLVEETLSD